MFSELETSCCSHWNCSSVDLLCAAFAAVQRLLGFPWVFTLVACKWESRGGWGYRQRDSKVCHVLIMVLFLIFSFQRTNGRVLPAQWRLLPPSKSSHSEGFNFEIETINNHFLQKEAALPASSVCSRCQTWGEKHSYVTTFGSGNATILKAPPNPKPQVGARSHL